AASGGEIVIDARLQLGGPPERDGVSDLQEIGRDGDLAPVHLKVAVGHHLPALAARRGEAQPVHGGVQAQLQQLQEVLPPRSLLAVGLVEVAAELGLQHSVDALGPLLLAELHAIRRQLAAVEPVLARRVVPTLDRALVGEATRPLEEELHALAAAQTALGVAVASHALTPAAASVGGSRRAGWGSHREWPSPRALRPAASGWPPRVRPPAP